MASPASPTAASVQASVGQVDAHAHTRRAAVGEAPVVEGLPPDYALGGRVVIPWRKMGAGVLVLAALGAAALLVKHLGGARGTAGEEKSDNLIKRNPSFEAAEGGKPAAWSLRGAAKGAIAVAPGGRTGSCMAVEKSASGGDLVLECAYAEEMALGRAAGVEVEAWARYDGFDGWAAVKVDWLKVVGGPVLAEEVSGPAARGAGWIPVRASFWPPAGAGAFRIALAAAGRGGRLAFDDVFARPAAGGAPARSEYKIGPHKVAVARNGTLQVETRGRRSIANLHVKIESSREGVSAQSCARDVSVTAEADRLVVRGKMVSPADLGPLDFEERVEHKGEGTEVWFGFPGAGLRRMDRVSLVFTLPKVDRVQGVPDAADRTTERISFASEEGDVVVQYSEPARIRVDQVRGGLRVVQFFQIDPGETDAEFGLRVYESASEVEDALIKVARERSKGRMGAALAILREEIKKVKDPSLYERFEHDMRELDEIEGREWAEVQAACFEACLSRLDDRAAAALSALEKYQQRWAGVAAFASKSESLRERTREVLSAAAAEEAGRHELIVGRAEQQLAAGRKALAGLMVRTFLARHPGSAAAPKARELLQRLTEP